MPISVAGACVIVMFDGIQHDPVLQPPDDGYETFVANDH